VFQKNTIKRLIINILYKKNFMKKNYSKIIKNIEKTRSKNNKNWMDILRLAFDSSPVKASKILSSIYKEDKKISNLAKGLMRKVEK
jgi:hypothetical protein